MIVLKHLVLKHNSQFSNQFLGESDTTSARALGLISDFRLQLGHLRKGTISRVMLRMSV